MSVRGYRDTPVFPSLGNMQGVSKHFADPKLRLSLNMTEKS